jgi:hypothetical protein
MRFDFDLESAPVLRPIPDGTYIFRVVGSKDLVSKANNNPMVQWECEIVEPKPVIVDGATVEKYFHYSTITPNTLGYVRELFDACERLKPGPWSPEDLYGGTFGATVIKTTDQQGRDINNIKRVFRVKDTRPEIKG